MRTFFAITFIAFAVYLVWAIGQDWGKRRYEHRVPIYGDQKR